MLSASVAAAQLTAREREGMDDTLFLANFRADDLAYERKGFLDRLRPSLIDACLDQPIASADRVMELHLVAKKSMSDLVRAGRKELLPVLRQTENEVKTPVQLTTLPPSLQGPVGMLVAALRSADADIELALAALGPADRQTLIQSLPRLAAEDVKLDLDFAPGSAAPIAKIDNLVKQVDFDMILATSTSLSMTVEKVLNQLRGSQADVVAPIRLNLGDLTILITGRGPDRINGTGADLILDLGGDDSYSGRPAFGLQKAAVAIDLGGSDRLQLQDGGGGVGLLGCGIMRMVGGDDTFQGRYVNFGVGLLGTGALAKEGGDDHYRNAVIGQGVGEYGVGLVIDTAGDDDYRLALMGQGAGRTRGLGWLVDRQGDDTYRAGGMLLNSPLFKDVNYSFAQGFGMGYREDTGGTSGGIGLLTDLSGMDAYVGETYCQAASYWYSLGSLFDGSGHDTYTAYHYAQASAMHATAAYLFDLRGDDGYLTKFGASHSIGHDNGVSFFLDREGNDIYSARDSAPGTGNARGVGIFLDAGGDDRYQGPPGVGNPSRGTGSVGLFADLGGQDKYYTGLADGEAAIASTWGSAYDAEDPVAPKLPDPEDLTTGQPGSLARPSDQELQRLYDHSRQWGVGTAQADVQKSIQQLILIGLPALEWMIDQKLASADRLAIRSFGAVIRGIGGPARDLFVRKMLTATNLDFLRNGLSVTSDASVREMGPVLTRLIRTPALQRQAVSTAGTIQATEAVGELLPLVAGVDRNLAMTAMVSLAQIGSEGAYPTAEAVVAQPNLPMRKAALALLAKFPDRATATGLRLLENPSERIARIGLELLSLAGTPDALKELGSRLADPSAGMRIQAALGLAGRCPAEHRAAFLALQNDPVPVVRAAARRLSP